MSAFDFGLAGHSIHSQRPDPPSRVGGAKSSPPRLVSDMHDTRRAAHAADRRSQRYDDRWAAEARREAELDYRVTAALGWCGPMALGVAGRRVAAPNDVSTTDVSKTARWRRAVRWIWSWRPSLGSRGPVPDGPARVRGRARTVAAPRRGQQ